MTVSAASGVRVRTVSEWTPLTPGVESRCLLEERGTALMLYRMDAGLRFALHQHVTAELGVVLSGEGRLLLGTEARAVTAGDTFFVGPATPHGFETIEDRGGAVVLNAVCPTRLDERRPLLEAIWGWVAENPDVRTTGSNGGTPHSRPGNHPVHRPRRRRAAPPAD
jgi:quercetin dioxygenase-like cupin family protein